jgi:hypothetical protein
MRWYSRIYVIPGDTSHVADVTRHRVRVRSHSDPRMYSEDPGLWMCWIPRPSSGGGGVAV